MSVAAAATDFDGVGSTDEKRSHGNIGARSLARWYTDELLLLLLLLLFLLDDAIVVVLCAYQS